MKSTTEWVLFGGLVLLLLGCGSSTSQREETSLAPTAELPAQPQFAVEQLLADAERAFEARDWAALEGALAPLSEDERGARGQYWLALARARTGAYQDAIDLASSAYERARSEGDDIDTMLSALEVGTRLKFRTGRGDEALGDLRDARDEHPESIEVEGVYLVALNRAGRHEEVLERARELLKRDETNIDAMRAMAGAYAALGKTEHAEFILERARDIDEAHVEVILSLAELAEKRGSLRRAISLLDKAVELGGDMPEARNCLGALFQRMGDYEGARQHLLRAVEDAPGFAEAWLNLGNAERGRKSYAEAERLYRKALLLDENLLEAHYNLGLLYLENNIEGLGPEDRLRQAIDELRTFASLVDAEADRKQVAVFIDEANQRLEIERQRRESELKSVDDGEDEGLDSEEDPDLDDDSGEIGGTDAPS